MDTKVDPYYMARAKELTNILFNKRLLADDLTRETIDGLEEFLGFLFQGYCNSAVMVSEPSRKTRATKQS